MDYLVSTTPVMASDQPVELKRPHSLKLEDEGPAEKQRRIQQHAQALLASPDLNFLKLNSPELERMLLAQTSMGTTPTPSQLSALTKVVTEEQDNFAKGFLEALNNLHQQNIHKPVPVPTTAHAAASETTPTFVELQTVTSLPTESTAVTVPLRSLAAPAAHTGPAPPLAHSGNVYTVPNVVDSHPSHFTVKQEDPQTVPQLSSSPDMQTTLPVDLHDQERMKLERKRARNRDAARRCRNRKLDRIATLEVKVKELKGHNSSLSDNAAKLREEVCKLKEQIMQHIRCGCQIMVGPNMKI